VGIELCRALAAIHAAGRRHGDIKSSNVVRDAGGAIVLLDFGSSRASGPSDDPGGPLSGTPLVMSPERLGRASLGPADDLYALGVLLYRLTSGHYPVEAASHAELEARLRRGERVPLRDHRPDLPGPFVQVVERALHTDPGERYASAGALEAALWGTLQIAAPADGAGRVPAGAGTPRWWPGAALVLTAVVALSLWVVRLPARHGRRLTTPPPFEVEATLFRTDDAGVARLTDGSRVQPGSGSPGGRARCAALHLRHRRGRPWRALRPLPGAGARAGQPAGAGQTPSSARHAGRRGAGLAGDLRRRPGNRARGHLAEAAAAARGAPAP
jgi:hypothetical protein